MSMEEKNQNDQAWAKPNNLKGHTCYYNFGVDCCDDVDCSVCGWNPFVSLSRITKKYGQKAGDYLTKPGD